MKWCVGDNNGGYMNITTARNLSSDVSNEQRIDTVRVYYYDSIKALQKLTVSFYNRNDVSRGYWYFSCYLGTDILFFCDRY